MARISDKEWEAYKRKYNKIYDSEEDCSRREIYSENKKRIEKHNELYKAGMESYAKGINQFTDMFAREVPKGYGRGKCFAKHRCRIKNNLLPIYRQRPFGTSPRRTQREIPKTRRGFQGPNRAVPRSLRRKDN